MRYVTFSGVFSWGVYYGYGLAFVFGIYITKANKSSELIYMIRKMMIMMMIIIIVIIIILIIITLMMMMMMS